MSSRKDSSSPEFGVVPWAKAVSTGPTSTNAPGPPTSSYWSQTTPKSKKKSAEPVVDNRVANEATSVQTPLQVISAAAER